MGLASGNKARLGGERSSVDQSDSRSRTDYRAIFDAANDAIFVHDAFTGAILEVNWKMCEMYGYSREEVTDIQVEALSAGIPPYAQEDAVRWIKRATEDGPQLFEWLARDKSGRLFWVEVNLKLATTGGKSMLLAVVRDISERKLVERELHKTKDYLNIVFDSVYDAIFIHELDGTIVDVNGKTLELYRVNREQATKLSIIHDYSSVDNPIGELPELWKKVKAGENQFFEWKARRPNDGSVFDVEVFLRRLPLKDRDLVLANVRDITERKLVERELRATKDYLRTVLNSVYDAIFVHDLDGTVVDVNDKLLEMYGVSWQEATRFTIIDYSAADNPIGELPNIWKRVMSGNDQFFEWRARRPKDGSVFDVEVFLRKLSLPDKDLVLANVRDITERKRANDALHTETQKFQTLAESAPVGMVLVDREDRFKYINPKFRDLFGYDLTDVSNVWEWFTKVYPDPTYRFQVATHWTSNVKASKPGERRPYTRNVHCNDGTEKIVSFLPVQLQTGGILMTCEDITERKQKEDEIRRRNIELAVLNDIVASVSSSIHLSEMLQTVRTVFADKLEIPTGGIFFCDEQRNKLTMEINWGIPETMLDAFEALASRWYGDDRLVREGEVILEKNNSDSSPSNDFMLPEFGNGGYSSLCIPLLVKGEIQGIIFLISREANVFRRDRFAFYKVLGQQIGVATQNACLFEEVRQSHARMQTLSLRLVEVQEAERRYIARELHDEIGQVLTGLKLALEMGARQSGEGTRGSLAEAQSLVNKLMVLVRELSLNLRPAMLDDLGLLPTLLWHFERFRVQTAIQVVFQHTGLNGRLPREVETAIFRIIQEALTNAARHARVDEVIVRVWADDNVIGAQIQDKGVGFDPVLAFNTAVTSGLKGMRERAVLLGGQFTVDAKPGAGAQLTAELPVNRGSQ